MSKMDDLRALREARYERTVARAARPAAPPPPPHHAAPRAPARLGASLAAPGPSPAPQTPRPPDRSSNPLSDLPWSHHPTPGRSLRRSRRVAIGPSADGPARVRRATRPGATATPEHPRLL